MTKMIISKQNLLSEQDRLSIIKDIEFELKHNPSQNKNKPLYQTMVNIHEKYVRINKIMVRKLNYLKNHAELGGQWSNLMVKMRFYEE